MASNQPSLEEKVNESETTDDSSDCDTSSNDESSSERNSDFLSARGKPERFYILLKLLLLLFCFV